MQFSKKYITEMKEKIYNKIHHSFLSSQLELPEIDNDKLYLLLSILRFQDLPRAQFETYATSVMFIQIALDTHDLVKNDDEYMQHKKRQLTVLAGDFYSGLYYYSLSHLPNIQMIRNLAEGIKIVNENKIRIYNKEVHSFEEYMSCMMKKETAIYQKLARYFHHPISELLSSNWLHINQIIKEKEKYMNYIKKNDLLEHSNLKGEKLNRFVGKQIDAYIDSMYSQLIEMVKEPSLIEDFLELIAFNKNNVNSTFIS
ncbi:heptaprenyl diphosphate synthase component 1 [Caldifermentibacillus hisashii]|uniref:heptaprenyl diphosphate synthase component 1 n=1 Tax=Caldifermentibacillus hisashii TaxID=996558 RepID=UPI0031B7BE6A